MSAWRLAVALLVVVWASACGPRRLQLPSGDGSPMPGFAEAFREATDACRQVNSLSAELGLSGRAGGQKLRGRVAAGIARPASIRLEGTAPFGPPVFILAADADRTTLLLPRDNRVLTGEPPAAILEALVGLDLGPEDLLAILTGCVQREARPAGGRSFENGWAAIDLEGGGRVFLQRDDRQQWQVRAATRRVDAAAPAGGPETAGASIRLEYERGPAAMPAAVHISSGESSGPPTELRISVSEPELNAALAANVFAVRVPADAQPISLAELRQAGPMGEKR